MFTCRLLNPNYSILGQLPDTEIYVDKSAFMDCTEVDQVKIFRFNSPLCYLNRTMFKSCIEKLLPSVYSHNSSSFCILNSRDQMCQSCDKVKYLIIDCSALAYCDYSGAGTLVDIMEELEVHDVRVFLAACPLKLINMMEKMQKIELLEHNIFPTISDAVSVSKYFKSRHDRAQLGPNSLSIPGLSSSDS